MEFVWKDPNAMVRAANVRATLDAFDLVPSFGRRVVEKYDLKVEDLLPGRFVLVQRWLDALRDIHTEVGPNVVRKVGTRIIANADFPPELGTVEAVLLALDDIYHLNHRGEVGHYRTSRLPDGSIIVRCETPYPRNFERGLIEGICSNEKLANGKRFRKEYEEGPSEGELTCTVVVHPA